ncbi:hypothetical protein GCM10022226_83160 [Sphaerisporangium flaviroseum]|uniref:Uncharacterized protein n=1 Tax=Sphaerisporangium flaviroseum TaxID=509199 RepID=A0ABP7JK29_9ACTN
MARCIDGLFWWRTRHKPPIIEGMTSGGQYAYVIQTREPGHPLWSWVSYGDGESSRLSRSFQRAVAGLEQQPNGQSR